MRILQARILEWVAMPSSRGIFPTWGSSQPKDQNWVSCIAGRSFTLWATREADMQKVLSSVRCEYLYSYVRGYLFHSKKCRVFCLIYTMCVFIDSQVKRSVVYHSEPWIRKMRILDQSNLCLLCALGDLLFWSLNVLVFNNVSVLTSFGLIWWLNEVMLVKASWQCPAHSNYWSNVGYVWIWALVLLISSMVWMLTLWFWKVYNRSEVFIGYTKSWLCEERRFMAGVEGV